MAKVELLIHVYQLDEEGSVEERAEGDKVPSAREWMLPSRELQGLWERSVPLWRRARGIVLSRSPVHRHRCAAVGIRFQRRLASLVYDGNIKSSLLDYIHTSLLFSDRGVDPNVISMNRCVC